MTEDRPAKHLPRILGSTFVTKRSLTPLIEEVKTSIYQSMFTVIKTKLCCLSNYNKCFQISFSTLTLAFHLLLFHIRNILNLKTRPCLKKCLGQNTQIPRMINYNYNILDYLLLLVSSEDLPQFLVQEAPEPTK